MLACYVRLDLKKPGLSGGKAGVFSVKLTIFCGHRVRRVGEKTPYVSYFLSSIPPFQRQEAGAGDYQREEKRGGKNPPILDNT